MTSKDDFEFDIGLVCMMNYNIGNNFCNYALYRYLTDLGYSVVLIATTKDMYWHFPNRQRMWMKVPYPEQVLSDENGVVDDLYLWNDRCRFFIVGSDQTFRYMYAYAMQSYTYLAFVRDEKYKASYASSFGVEPFEAPKSKISEIAYYFQRFNRLSVREKAGQRILKDNFGLDAECVLDPIFLCNVEHYVEMMQCGKSRLPKKPYTFAYILDDSESKEEIILRAADMFTEGNHAAMLERCWEYESDKDEELSIIQLHKNEEWLAGIYGSEFVVTDSFHCICFCILFQRQFCVVYDPENWRGWARIENILQEFNLLDRHVRNQKEFEIADFKNHFIDFNKVNKLLCEKIQASKAYLKKILDEAVVYKRDFTSFDKSGEMLYKMSVLVRKFQESFDEYRTAKDVELEKMKSDAYLVQRVGNRSHINVIAWGAGDCLHRNIHKLDNVYDIKYVCDNNPDLWGKDTEDGVKIISPKKLMEFTDPFVIIMIDNGGVCLNVVRQLLEMGIDKFDHIENWLRAIGKIPK